MLHCPTRSASRMGRNGLLISLDWLANTPFTVSSSSATVGHVVLGVIAIVFNAETSTCHSGVPVALTNVQLCAAQIV